MTGEQIDAAYEDGWRACGDGFELSDNPYGHSELEAAWEKGWLAYDQNADEEDDDGM